MHQRVLLIVLYTGVLLWLAERHAAAGAPGASISLSPAVVTLRTSYGTAHSRSIRLTNNTRQILAYEMDAADVVTRDGQRIFLAAGEEPDSIAATAVFSERDVVVAPGATAEVTVTLTIPPATAVRAVAVMFRGKTGVPSSREGVGMTASLGSLVTFTLSDGFRIEASPVEVTEQSEHTNPAFSQWLTNTGSEPVIASGLVALLNSSGALVGKVPIEAQRLLPGERLEFRTDYPSELAPGRYRAVLSIEYENKILTSSADLVVAAKVSDSLPADSVDKPGR